MTYPLTNVLLDSLPPDSLRLISPQLMRVPLPIRTSLYESNETPRYVHFLTSGIASVVTTMSDGQTIEVATVGREGAPQGIHLLAPMPVPSRCFMQVAGTGFRVEFRVLARLQAQDEHLRRALLAYAQYQNLMVGQFVACSRLHGVKARLARWLLMLQDRTGDSVLKLTQAFLADMIGSQRTTVTEVAGALETEGVVEHERGTVHILNRSGLENISCECYWVTRKLLSCLYAMAGQSVLDTNEHHPTRSNTTRNKRCS